MPILKINFNLANVLANLLPKIVVKGAGKNIHKSRVQKWIIEQLQDIEKERQSIIEQFAEKDEQGNKIIVDNNMYKLTDGKAYDAAYTELIKECEIIIDASSDIAKEKALTTVRDILSTNESVELNAQESLAYSELVDIFESCIPYPKP